VDKQVDKRGVLDEEVFTYKISKDNKVFIYWLGKQVTIIQGKEAEKFMKRIENADFKEQQLIMAKVTGNFKRGNEKQNKRS
jgi:hypothetical protein